MATSQIENNAQLSSYLIAAATTAITGGNETPLLCDIKILCSQRKKKSKRYTNLTFVDSASLLSSPNEQPCIEILGKTNPLTILFDDCISMEYFDTIGNDFQTFIYIYFESYTVSIYFSEEHIQKKPLIIKHLDYMYQKRVEQSKEMSNPPSSSGFPCLPTTEHILHTFDVKLIPFESIITRDHALIGPVRLYFTTTDLYIASRDCNPIDLRTTITNQCPAKNKDILCIPYFTIKHYGNRSNFFLIELGKSNYGNGEIHMQCLFSSLASTIHLLVSPVIEERPLILSSAFQNRLLTRKRIEKSEHLHPPIQLNYPGINQSIFSNQQQSTESLFEQSNMKKSRSVFGFLRKLVHNKKSLQRSCTFDNNQIQETDLLPPIISKFFELNIDEKKVSHYQNEIIVPNSQIINHELLATKQETTSGTYIDMDSTVQKSDPDQLEEIKEEEMIKEPTATVDVGVNTIISLSPHVRSAIIVGTTVHLIAEERAVFPIGQRSFTSPASVMQPFKAQLTGQTNPTTTYTSNPHQSLFLSYGIVTINNSNSLITDQTEEASDDSTISRRLNSDLSLMSITHQQQPSNMFSFDNLLSSSSSSHIFRTLSLSTTHLGDNTSGRIIFLDENFPDPTTTYLLRHPPAMIASIDHPIQTNLTTPILRPPLDGEKLCLDDSYALTEPLTFPNSALSSPLTVITKPSLASEKPIHYTDLLFPLTPGDEQEESPSSDENDLIEEKTERSTTVFYTDIDFHQTQRRDRLAQFTVISKTTDQIPPFVL